MSKPKSKIISGFLFFLGFGFVHRLVGDTLKNRGLRILLLTNSFILLAGAMLGPIQAIFVDKVGGDLMDAGIAGGIFSLSKSLSWSWLLDILLWLLDFFHISSSIRQFHSLLFRQLLALVTLSTIPHLTRCTQDT